MKKTIKSIIFLIIIIFIIGFGWYSFQMKKTYKVPANELFIEEGLGVKQISSSLEATGYIHNDFIFRVYIWKHKLEDKIYAGHYLLPDEISMKDLVDYLTGNNSFAPSRKITIIEGWHTKNIAEVLKESAAIDSDEFYSLVGYPLSHEKNNNGKTNSKDYTEEFEFLNDKPKDVGLEGYLFPDTYEIALDADAEEVVLKMLNNLKSKLTQEVLNEIKKSEKSFYEVITIASILERELKDFKEKKLGAGLIYERLEIGMPLQMDSSINFVTGKKAAQSTLVDLEIDSPYNTYKYKGLPPGPISNPGIDSIKAAVYPVESDYLFFLTDKDGIAHFSKTYEEHLSKKRKYLD